MTKGASVQAAFESHFHQPPQGVAVAPGRVNLIGEHIDYNGGIALPCAINLRASFASAPRADQLVDIVAIDLGQRCQFSLEHLEDRRTIEGTPLPQWAQYFAGVAWAFSQAGFKLRGLNGLIQSNIPIGAGLSSSAAIEVATATAWLAAGNYDADPMQVAKLCQRAENEFVGVNSGLMDQWTVTHGQRDHALLLDFAQVTCKPVKLPESISLVIADSGWQRSLSDSAYSQRVRDCQQVLSVLRQNDPSLQYLGQATMGQLEEVRTELSISLYRRGRHVISEVGRVRLAVDHLTSNEASAIGPLLLQSHTSLRDDYQVSSDGLDLLVELAVDLPGCYGARLTGAGFGGCTINWVEKSEAEDFRSRLLSEYQERAGIQTEAWICRAVEAGQWLELAN